MNTQPEALRLADAIDGAYWEWKDVPKMATELRRLHEENQALRQAPSTPEQEPVAWIRKNGFRFDANLEPQDDSEIPLYTAPPKQPEQRPVGTYEGVMEAMLSLRNGTIEQQQVYGHMKDKLLYTAPPKREWVGLTNEEIWEMEEYKQALTDEETRFLYRFAKTIQAKLKEKNT